MDNSLLKKKFYKSFIYSRNLDNFKDKKSIDNFFWYKSSCFFKKNKRGNMQTKIGKSYYDFACVSRFKFREFQELGLLPILKK